MANTSIQSPVKSIGENSHGPEIIAASPRGDKVEKKTQSIFDMVMQSVRSMKNVDEAGATEQNETAQKRVEELVAEFKEFMEDHPQLDLINGLFQWLSARIENMEHIPQELQKTLGELTAMLEGLLKNVAEIDSRVLLSVENEIRALLSGNEKDTLADGRLFQSLKDKLQPILSRVSSTTGTPAQETVDSGQNHQANTSEKPEQNAAASPTADPTKKSSEKTGSTVFVSRISDEKTENPSATANKNLKAVADKTTPHLHAHTDQDGKSDSDKSGTSSENRIFANTVSEKAVSIEDELKGSVKIAEAADTRLEKAIKSAVSSRDTATDARAAQDVKGVDGIAKPDSPVPTVMKNEAAAVTPSTASRIVENAENIENIRKIVQDFNISRLRNFETVRINLEPPELGKMQIRLVMNGSDLNAVIQTESAEAKELLTRNLNSLRQVLADKGVSVENFDVSSEADHSFSEQPGTQEAFAGASRTGNGAGGIAGETGAEPEETDMETDSQPTSPSGKIDLVA